MTTKATDRQKVEQEPCPVMSILCAESKLEILRMEMARLAQQLRKWAVESCEGGWSTHQVDPMRRKADEIDEILERVR